MTKTEGLRKTLMVLDAISSYVKTASDEIAAIDQIGDTFVKIAEDTYPDEHYKVASLIADTISLIDENGELDAVDFIEKAATAETIYNKLANSDNLLERELADLAVGHINAIFTKIAQMGAPIDWKKVPTEHLQNLYDAFQHNLAASTQLAMEHENLQRAHAEQTARNERLKKMMLFGAPAALGVGMAVPYIVDKLTGK